MHCTSLEGQEVTTISSHKIRFSFSPVCVVVDGCIFAQLDYISGYVHVRNYDHDPGTRHFDTILHAVCHVLDGTSFLTARLFGEIDHQLPNLPAKSIHLYFNFCPGCGVGKWDLPTWLRLAIGPVWS